MADGPLPGISISGGRERFSGCFGDAQPKFHFQGFHTLAPHANPPGAGGRGQSRLRKDASQDAERPGLNPGRGEGGGGGERGEKGPPWERWLNGGRSLKDPQGKGSV